MEEKRTIVFSHISSLQPLQLVQYFLDSNYLEKWLCDSVKNDLENNCLYLTYGQDHFVKWQIRGSSSNSIQIHQIWMSEYEIDIDIEFSFKGNTTLVEVFLIGEISSEMEKEYHKDWSGLEKLP